MSKDRKNTASLEGFISAFNRFEAEAEVFSLQDGDGYPWWDLVRYRVQFELCMERDIFGRPEAMPRSKLVQAKSFANQFWLLARDIARLYGRRACLARTLVVSSRSLDYLERLTVAEGGDVGTVLYFNKLGFGDKPHIAVTYRSIQFAIRLTKWAPDIPADIVSIAQSLADDIRARFDSEVDVFHVITNKYREELMARRLWSFVLGRAFAVESLLYVNDDSLKSLVALARAKGIDTKEVQHGYIGRGHIAFNYPPLEARLATLPNSIIITRDSGDIAYPVEPVFFELETKKRDVVPRDIDVLIGSNPGRGSETADVVAALSGLGLLLAVKLHPAETKETAEVTQRFSPNEVVIYEGDEDFCDLSWRSRVFVPVNAHSTTAFEAADMGALVVLVDFNGVKKTAISDGVASARATSLRTLPSVVLSQVAASKAKDDRQKCDDK